MTLNGHVENGAIVIDDAVDLPEGARVRVEVEKERQDRDEATIPTIYERMKAIVDAAEDLPEDAATNVDRYLYGPRP
jgi:hypothetical protein